MSSARARNPSVSQPAHTARQREIPPFEQFLGPARFGPGPPAGPHLSAGRARALDRQEAAPCGGRLRCSRSPRRSNAPSPRCPIRQVGRGTCRERRLSRQSGTAHRNGCPARRTCRRPVQSSLCRAHCPACKFKSMQRGRRVIRDSSESSPRSFTRRGKTRNAAS